MEKGVSSRWEWSHTDFGEGVPAKPKDFSKEKRGKEGKGYVRGKLGVNPFRLTN